jgi:type IV/VI secretion system ImpK/VasF family protein
MTLLEACEPLFQRICELNRTSRAGGTTPDYQTLRREMVDLLKRVRDTMLVEPEIERHWAKVELPLIFFVDSMIAESNLAAASEWNQHRLAYDLKELAGDQKFFDLLDETLQDTSSDASERLAVFYTCIGLGFCGFYGNQYERLRNRMTEMLQRIDPTVRGDLRMRVCPEAYQHTDTRDLVERPPLPRWLLLSLFLGLCLVGLAIWVFLYQEATLQMREDLRAILKQAREPVINWPNPFL